MNEVINMFWMSFQANLSALETSIDKAIYRTSAQDEKQTVFNTMNNTIHSLMDYWERVKSSSFQNETKKMMRAFAYANNKLKHADSLVSITARTGGFEFNSFTFPINIPPIEFVFTDLDSFCREGRDENDNKMYNEYLRGKNVIECFKEVALLIEYK